MEYNPGEKLSTDRVARNLLEESTELCANIKLYVTIVVFTLQALARPR